MANEGITNGMQAPLLDALTRGGVQWRRSRASGQLGNCIETATIEGGDIAVRNSRFPTGVVLIFTRDEMAAWVTGAKDGEFDDYLA